MRSAVLALALGTGVLGGCSSEDPVVFPADYATTYQEVRNCRQSSDHDLHRIRVVADPIALQPYLDRTGSQIPVGGIVLKEEYDFADTDCEGPVVEWTVMKRLAATNGDLGWQWQRVDAERTITDETGGRCISCHTSCGSPPDGFDGTCTVP